MSHPADTTAGRPSGAQTVAPVQASALLHAASILGEASYTPEQELKGTLHAAARTEAQPTAQPTAQPVAQPVAPPAVQPVVAAPPARAAAAPAEPVAAPQPAERKGFLARLLDKLLGRG
ncbi:hypothetical protein AB2L27_14010 [Kineococcus sp. LSe6-4]|uniref:Uncharacterized protein n=1 Tax=Kineococcus halophytocola TaxID=3234027 RepID=A0ABV4H2R3_9ACTN